MFSSRKELHFLWIRYLLLAAWCVMLALCFVDAAHFEFTDPASENGLQGWAGSPINLRGDILLPISYNPVPRLFWGGVVPIVILTLLFFGHDTWRRICPLSALSQLPRRLGFQIKTGRKNRRRIFSVNPNSAWARHALLFQFIAFLTVVILRLTLLSAYPQLLAYFTFLVFLLAFVVGLFFAGKTWCHYFCPMNAVQLVLSGPKGVNSDRSKVNGLSQSMCRKPQSSGKDISICVGCNAPCPDVDIEKNYWSRIDRLSARVVTYGYLGIVVGFYHALFSIAGTTTLGAAVWYDGDWNGLGFAPFGTNMPVVRWLGLSIVVVVWTAVSVAAGLLLEKLLAQYYRAKENSEPEITATHQLMLVFSFSAILMLIQFIALPGLNWLPTPIIWLLSVSSSCMLAIWLSQSWRKTANAHQRELLAQSLQQQLSASEKDWAPFLDGRSPDQLSVDEIHMLANLTREIESSGQKTFYKRFLKDAIEQGTANSKEGKNLLQKVRNNCGVTRDEHRAYLIELTGENEVSDTLLMSNRLRLDAFKVQLEGLLLAELASGKQLADIVRDRASDIAQIRENFSISDDEVDKVLDEISNENSRVFSLVEALTLQVKTLAALRLKPESVNGEVLNQYLFDQLKGVVSEIFELMHLIETASERKVLLGQLNAVLSEDLINPLNEHLKNNLFSHEKCTETGQYQNRAASKTVIVKIHKLTEIR